MVFVTDMWFVLHIKIFSYFSFFDKLSGFVLQFHLRQAKLRSNIRINDGRGIFSVILHCFCLNPCYFFNS